MKDLGGSGSLYEIDLRVIEILDLPSDLVAQPHPARPSQTELQYRLAWARTNLKQDGLIENHAYKLWRLTALGVAEPTDTPDPTDTPVKSEAWSAFIRWAREFFEWEGFDASERNYKLEIADKLDTARAAFLSKEGDWMTLLRQAFGPPNNLTSWRTHLPFLNLLGDNQNAAERALLEIWKPDESLSHDQNNGNPSEGLDGDATGLATERLRKFLDVLSEISNVSEIRFSMPEVLGSFLSMGLNPDSCPIYRADPLRKAYRLTSTPVPPKGSTSIEKYEHGIRFLNEVYERCIGDGLSIRDLLDAQSIVWSITKGTPPEHWEESKKEEFLHFRGELASVPVAIDPDIDYWMVGTYVGENDQTLRFISDGYWESNNEKFSDLVLHMKVGDRIALRTIGSQTSGLQFDNFGHTVSKYSIHAVGTISKNPENGSSVEVDWDELWPDAREWYLFTSTASVWQLDKNPASMDHHLIRFTFHGASQDYALFSDVRWSKEDGKNSPEPDVPIPYSTEDVLKEGVFLTLPEVESIISRINTKRNVILEGAPGVGKTFVSRKLAYALMGAKDDAKITTIQLHPSYSYEDFVRGYRPTNEAGRFEMRDGPFLELCEAAYSEPDQKFVIIIDEINRGNLSQIFGEMFSLLESGKRGKANEITPLYRRSIEDRVSVPSNLYVIGTMNISDRSLALVDYALRRRFAFIRLEPQFTSQVYKDWLIDGGMKDSLANKIITSMTTLNGKISEDRQLGPAYQIGHSFFCPPGEEFSTLDTDWFNEIIKTEIRPLVEEYWFDELEKVEATITEVFG